ncbi:MAG: 4Fe-4S ferredoxin [Nitrospirae bacterium]|nr:4Fe-4S ferredoxin [Nitrospirota bacterium]
MLPSAIEDASAPLLTCPSAVFAVYFQHNGIDFQRRMFSIMGHVVGKDIYRRLGVKIDNLTFRTPWNETFPALLKELFEPEEANLVVRMPATLTTFNPFEMRYRIRRGAAPQSSGKSLFEGTGHGPVVA